MERTKMVKFYSTWSDTSNILNCVLSYPASLQDVTVEVEQNKIGIKSEQFTKVFMLNDLNLHPDTCRGLSCQPGREIHFSIKAEPTVNSEHIVNEDIDTSHVIPSQLKLSQNDLVDRIQLLQNKWYCATCRQKLLADRCILSKVLPLPSENWSDYADMWFCHKHEGDEPVVKKQKFLPKLGQCFVGETYILISGNHVQNGAIKVSKDGSLTCSRCGNQLGHREEADGSISNGDIYKLFIHTLKIEHLMLDSAIKQPSVSSDQAEVFFSRLLLEQCQLYTSFRFLVETSLTNGYKNPAQTSSVSTCLVWLLDSDVTVYKSSSDEQSEQDLQKDHIIKVLFKCHLVSSTENSRPTDYVTKSLLSLWRKDNTVHGFTLHQSVFLQFIHVLVENCKRLSPSQRYLNGFHVSYISKDNTTVK